TRIVYRDGVEVARDTAKGPYTGSGPLRLGGADQSKAQVLLDEVRIWNRARTADELQADQGHRLTGQENGLLPYRSFPGPHTTHLSRHGRHRTLVSNPHCPRSRL